MKAIFIRTWSLWLLFGSKTLMLEAKSSGFQTQKPTKQGLRRSQSTAMLRKLCQSNPRCPTRLVNFLLVHKRLTKEKPKKKLPKDSLTAIAEPVHVASNDFAFALWRPGRGRVASWGDSTAGAESEEVIRSSSIYKKKLTRKNIKHRKDIKTFYRQSTDCCLMVVLQVVELHFDSVGKFTMCSRYDIEFCSSPNII